MAVEQDQKLSNGAWKNRVLRLFTQPIKLPGWAALILFIYTIVPDTYSRIEFWIDAAKTTGGYVAIAADLVGSKYFGPCLLIFGLLWILFVGEPQKGVQRHHWLRYVGWSVFLICVAAVAVTATYGWFELRLRESYAAGAAGIPRGAPGENSPNRVQKPLFAGQWGLSEDQIRILLVEVPKLKPYIKFVTLARPSVGNQAFAYITPLQDIFNRSGLSFSVIAEDPRDPTEEGLMLAVADPNQVPLSAQKIREAFEIANIQLRLISMPDNLKMKDRDFIIFIGPRPVNWR